MVRPQPNQVKQVYLPFIQTPKHQQSIQPAKGMVINGKQQVTEDQYNTHIAAKKLSINQLSVGQSQVLMGQLPQGNLSGVFNL